MTVDIITTSGLTGRDGSVIAAGAVIKFETEFPIGFSGFVSRLRVYRSKAIYENGYSNVSLKDFDNEIREDLGEEFFNLTPLILYNKVVENINNQYGATVCEVQTIN